MVGIKWKLKLIYSFVLNLTPVARVLSVRLYLEDKNFFSIFPWINDKTEAAKF